MRPFLLVLFLCLTSLLRGQNDTVVKQKKLDKTNEKVYLNYNYYKSSTITNEEFQEEIFNNLERKEELIDEIKLDEIEQQNDQKGIIESQKERGKTISKPNQPILLPIIVSKKESLAISVSESEVESKWEKNNQRLFGPSQFDSRLEPLQLNPSIEWQNKLLQCTNSVGMIVEKEKLTPISNELFQLDNLTSLGEKFNLCPHEAFYNQPVVGVGTAWVSGEQTLLTAWHVLERPLSHYVVVFGYQIINKNGVVSSFIPKSEIYEITAISQKNEELDVAEIKVNKTINRPVLEWENTFFDAKKGNEIYMIGYPSGLPMKLALNAAVEENTHPYYFYTSLDGFQGNSGSPVFNFYTHKVIGILVSGEIDYKFNGTCYSSPLCKYPYCKGEKVIRIEQVMNTFR